MDLRTLGDIDGYERSRGGETPLPSNAVVLRDGSHGWECMFVHTFVQHSSESRYSLTVGVFLIPTDHKVLLLRLSTRARAHQKRQCGVRNDEG